MNIRTINRAAKIAIVYSFVITIGWIVLTIEVPQYDGAGNLTHQLTGLSGLIALIQEGAAIEFLGITLVPVGVIFMLVLIPLLIQGRTYENDPGT